MTRCPRTTTSACSSSRCRADSAPLVVAQPVGRARALLADPQRGDGPGVAQLVEPDSGILQIAGQVVERADSPGARRSVGWAPHEPLAWRDDTVLQNLRYACRLAGMSRTNAAARASESVAAWNLDSVTDAAVRRLSRGWAQRYSLARADLLQPPVMLLDEPTTGLDSGARAMLEGALDRWRSTRIVIVASHEREWLFKRADQVLDLDLARVPVEKVDA